MNKTLLFRADGNNKSGLGHLYRIFALIKIFDEKYDCILLTRSDTNLLVLPSGIKVKGIPNSIEIYEEPKWLSSRFRPTSHIIIADGYNFKSQYQNDLKNEGFSLVYIDDLAEEYMYADIVVNHSPNIEKEDYKSENHTSFALGSKFSMLRPLFLEAAKIEHKQEPIREAFICFGGSDQLDLTYLATQAMINQNQIEGVNVVLGGSYNHTRIFKLDKDNTKLSIFKNLSERELYDVMSSCQLAFVSSSTILYEVCSVKMATISGYYVDNQIGIYKGMLRKDAIFGAGDLCGSSIENFKNIIASTISSTNIENKISNQQKLFKGNTKSNFLKLILELQTKFRVAHIDDLNLVFKWSNQKEVRKNSFNQEKIGLEEHKKWFNSKLNSHDCLFLIILFNDNPAGFVRYDIKEKQSVVSVLVSKPYRGMGLAQYSLKKTSENYFSKYKLPIHAYIKTSNEASRRVFEKAGYIFERHEMINDSRSYLFKLN